MSDEAQQKPLSVKDRISLYVQAASPRGPPPVRKSPVPPGVKEPSTPAQVEAQQEVRFKEKAVANTTEPSSELRDVSSTKPADHVSSAKPALAEVEKKSPTPESKQVEDKLKESVDVKHDDQKSEAQPAVLTDAKASDKAANKEESDESDEDWDAEIERDRKKSIGSTSTTSSTRRKLTKKKSKWDLVKPKVDSNLRRVAKDAANAATARQRISRPSRAKTGSGGKRRVKKQKRVGATMRKAGKLSRTTHKLTKRINTVTAKKKNAAFWIDLDDEEWSEDDEMDLPSTKADNQNGPASRQLGEFEVTSEMENIFVTAEKAHNAEYTGCFEKGNPCASLSQQLHALSRDMQISWMLHQAEVYFQGYLTDAYHGLGPAGYAMLGALQQPEPEEKKKEYPPTPKLGVSAPRPTIIQMSKEESIKRASFTSRSGFRRSGGGSMFLRKRRTPSEDAEHNKMPRPNKPLLLPVTLPPNSIPSAKGVDIGNSPPAPGVAADGQPVLFKKRSLRSRSLFSSGSQTKLVHARFRRLSVQSRLRRTLTCNNEALPDGEA